MSASTVVTDESKHQNVLLLGGLLVGVSEHVGMASVRLALVRLVSVRLVSVRQLFGYVVVGLVVT